LNGIPEAYKPAWPGGEFGPPMNKGPVAESCASSPIGLMDMLDG